MHLGIGHAVAPLAVRVEQHLVGAIHLEALGAVIHELLEVLEPPLTGAVLRIEEAPVLLEVRVLEQVVL